MKDFLTKIRKRLYDYRDTAAIYLNIALDYSQQAQEKIQYYRDIIHSRSDYIISISTYLPFIGWILPMAKRKDDGFTMFHAKQGFIIALFFVVVLTGLSFLMVFLPTTARAFKLALVILIYLAEIFYFFLCVRGTIFIRDNKREAFPYLSKYIDMLDF